MRNKLEVKICGMKNAANIDALLQLPIDYIGLIFYDKSARFAGAVDPTIFEKHAIKKVGVFVDSTIDEVLRRQEAFRLDVIQLHGQESVSYCEALNSKGIQIWKAFGVDAHFDFGTLAAYTPFVDRFLFDTKTPQHGGSGQVFDWSLLDQYQEQIPYMLSGGIGEHNLASALAYQDQRLAGLDLNSKFETAAGIKNIELVHKALKIIHHEQISGR